MAGDTAMYDQLTHLSFVGFGWDCSCLSNPSGYWAGSAAQPLTLQPLYQRQQLPAWSTDTHVTHLPLPGQGSWMKSRRAKLSLGQRSHLSPLQRHQLSTAWDDAPQAVSCHLQHPGEDPQCATEQPCLHSSRCRSTTL